MTGRDWLAVGAVVVALAALALIWWRWPASPRWQLGVPDPGGHQLQPAVVIASTSQMIEESRRRDPRATTFPVDQRVGVVSIEPRRVDAGDRRPIRVGWPWTAAPWRPFERRPYDWATRQPMIWR